MSEKNKDVQAEATVSLTDGDIVSSRHMTRRSLLASTRFGIGLGVAAVVFGGSRPAAASDRANTYDNDSGDRRPTTDND